MANPNPEIWRDDTNWVYSSPAYGLMTTLAKTLNADRVKIINFGGSNDKYRGALKRGIAQNYITANTPLDATICPCGQDAKVSPWGKFAVFETWNSATPTKIVESEKNVNWFFGDFPNAYNGANYEITPFLYSKTSTYFQKQQWSPNSVASSNGNYDVIPYASWGLRSVVLQIWIRLIPKNATSVTSTIWTTLSNWASFASTHDCLEMALFQSATSSINTSTLALTYTQRSDSIPSDSQKTGQVFFITDVDINGVNTEFLSFNISQSYENTRSATIFAPTDTHNNSNIPILPCWNYFDGQVVKVENYSSSSKRLFYAIPYSEENYNRMLSIAALFGCFFTPTSKYQFAYEMTDNDLYLPIIDENGVAHGEYTRGSENANNPLYSKNSIRDIDYDPTKPPTPIDPNTYSNVTNFNLVTESAAMTRRYVLDAANVEKLGDDLWTICQEIATGGDFEYFDGKLKNEFLTTNPIDCIISLMRFPFNIPYQLQPLQSYVKLGRSEGSAKGWITVFISNQINFAGVNIFPRFGNCYLDYEPYTTYELYIPFCGTTKIRAADILGHTLNVSMIIDLITGSCTAYIKADQLVIETVNGSCGVSQQISGIDTATMNANIYNGILNQKQAKTQLLTQAASALMPSNWVNPIGYAAKGEQAESSYKAATYAIEHMESPVHNIGAASPLLGWIQEFDARLLIYYPEGDVIDSNIPPSFKAAPLAAFGHLKGFATATPGNVSNFQMSGKAAFISGDIIPDDIPCTLSERNRIKSMFADGVYLPPL